MHFPLIPLIVLAAFAVIVIRLMGGPLLRRKLSNDHPNKTDDELGAPVSEVPSLLSDAEYSFFRVLEVSVADRARIFCKVRLLDIVNIDKSTPTGFKWFNKISQRHVDYLLCHKDTLKPLCAIELDDKSHSAEPRKAKDEELNRILLACGIDCARFRASHSYSPSTIADRISRHLVQPCSPVDHPDARYLPVQQK